MIVPLVIAIACAAFMHGQPVPSGSVGIVQQGGFVTRFVGKPAQWVRFRPWQSIATIQTAYSSDTFILNGPILTADGVPVSSVRLTVFNHVNQSDSEALVSAWLALRYSALKVKNPSIRLASGEGPKLMSDWGFEPAVLEAALERDTRLVIENTDAKTLVTHAEMVAAHIQRLVQEDIAFPSVFVIDRMVIAPSLPSDLQLNRAACTLRWITDRRPEHALQRRYVVDPSAVRGE